MLRFTPVLLVLVDGAIPLLEMKSRPTTLVRRYRAVVMKEALPFLRSVLYSTHS